jgi:hypothetical protein
VVSTEPPLLKFLAVFNSTRPMDRVFQLALVLAGFAPFSRLPAIAVVPVPTENLVCHFAFSAGPRVTKLRAPSPLISCHLTSNWMLLIPRLLGCGDIFVSHSLNLAISLNEGGQC